MWSRSVSPALENPMDQDIKSRPKYEKLRRDDSGRFHLLLADRNPVSADAFDRESAVDAFDECWMIEGHSRAMPKPDPAARSHAFRSQEHMLIALRHRLAREHMGLRLYAVGTEPFVWAIHGIGDEHGLGCSEMRVHAAGSAARRVYCNHCRTITMGVTASIFQCSGCNASLFVRDHFSRRLNSFAGIQIDAEVPGDVPPAEELYL